MEDRYRFDQNTGGGRRRPAAGESMAGGALVVAVIGLVSVCCVYPGMVCGALAVILALLSRGQNKRPSASGRLALTLGTAAIVLSIVVIVINMIYIMSNYGSIDAFMESYKATMDELTGGAYSELYGSYGF